MKKLLLPLLLISFFNTFSQNNFDTVRVVQYNLTKYDGFESVCTLKPYTERNGYIATIVDYTKPDILGVVEINRSRTSVSRILSGALNANGRTFYDSAQYYGLGGDQIANMLFFNKNKFRLVSQSFIDCSPRDANIYDLEYKDSNAVDKPRITVVVVHLKASSSTSDQSQRAVCSANIMSYLQSNYGSKSNLIVMGDFNIYRTGEQAYSNFTTNANSKINLIDPIYALTTLDSVNLSYKYQGYNAAIGTGTWNNSVFAPFHTQCPSVTQANCFVGGGLDDRFDYILMNKSILDDSAKINFIPNTYKAIGNDGLHYNKAINDGDNNSAPESVINALISNSDHLPIVANFKIRVGIPPLDPITPAYLDQDSIFINNSKFTVSGIYLSDIQTITIIGSIYEANKERMLTTFVGSFLGENITENTTITTISISKSNLPDPTRNWIKGSFFKSTTSISITTNAEVISGKVSENVADGVITIIGTHKNLSNNIISNTTLIGNYTITASKFTITINPSFYVLDSIATVSILEFENEKFQLSPNPVTTELSIAGLADNKNTSFRIFDMQGIEKTIGSLSKSDYKIQVKQLNPGIYFILIDQKHFLRFIKE